MVTWFAGLFYLPRLFVYHAMSADAASSERFKVMERKLYYGIMTPGAVLTIVSGLGLWLGYGHPGGWLHAKLGVRRGSDRLSPVVRSIVGGVSSRSEPTCTRLVSLVQRSADCNPDCYRRSRGGEALLACSNG